MKGKIVNLKMLVDTQKISVVADNLHDYEMFNDGYEFVKNGTVNDKIKDGNLYKNAVIQPNKMTKVYKPIHALTEYEEVTKYIYNVIGVIDLDKVDLNRIDIAVDSDLEFHPNFKKILFLFELVTQGESKSDKWYTTKLKTLKNNTIIAQGRSLEICFYDKADESKNKHYARTRFEFRFKRISSSNIVEHIQKIKGLVSDVEKAIEPLEEDMSQRLIKLYEEDTKIKSFSEFVRKYDRFFYTIGILEKVYKTTGLKGNAKKWVSKFRENNNTIEFFTKSDASEFKREVNKALKNYIKS